MTRIAVGAALLVATGYALATTSFAHADDPVPTVTVTTTERVAAMYHGRPIWHWYNVARYQRSQSRAWHRQTTKLGVRVRRLQDVVRGLRARLRPKRTPVPSGGVRATICAVFGSYCSQALRVVACETGGTFSVHADNGAGYLGLFQFGSYARSTYGFGWDALTQSRAAYRYFAASGYSWGPWSCKP